jgi:hypothetical protein
MAHAYTTKRGKNKKSKLGVRKDQQQNQERSLKGGPNLSAFLYDGPKEAEGLSIGRISSHSVNQSRLESVKTRLQKALMDKCSNPSCENASEGIQLAECAACHQTRYCSKDCQKAHWADHKILCKTVRENLKKLENEKQQMVLQALQEMGIKDGAKEKGEIGNEKGENDVNENGEDEDEEDGDEEEEETQEESHEHNLKQG